MKVQIQSRSVKQLRQDDLVQVNTNKIWIFTSHGRIHNNLSLLGGSLNAICEDRSCVSWRLRTWQLSNVAGRRREDWGRRISSTSLSLESLKVNNILTIFLETIFMPLQYEVWFPTKFSVKFCFCTRFILLLKFCSVFNFTCSNEILFWFPNFILFWIVFAKSSCVAQIFILLWNGNLSQLLSLAKRWLAQIQFCSHSAWRAWLGLWTLDRVYRGQKDKAWPHLLVATTVNVFDLTNYWV